jgi:hypothetical protein
MVKAMGGGQLNSSFFRFSNSCSENVVDSGGRVISNGDAFVDLIAKSGVTVEVEQSNDEDSNTEPNTEPPSVEKLTLKSLYDDVRVQETVRSIFSIHVLRQMERGGSTLKLHHLNNIDETIIHSVIPVKELGDITVDDFLAAIPHNKDGPLPGAAFPIHLSISIEEDSTNGGYFM